MGQSPVSLLLLQRPRESSGRACGSLHLGACPGTGASILPTTARRSVDSHSRRTRAMTTIEALRTQLAAMPTELYSLQAENQRLKEDHPQAAEALETERELHQTREENVRRRSSWWEVGSHGRKNSNVQLRL